MDILHKISSTKFHKTITTWEEFRRNWGDLHNFLIGGELTEGFDFPLPPLEQIIEEVRMAPGALFRSGVKDGTFDLSDIKKEFCSLPVAEAIKRQFVLAHFGLHPELTGRGNIFEGLEARWVEPWRQQLQAHGFGFDRVYAIFFASGPNSASNYHIDCTHQLAKQCYGTKYFSGLKNPNRWTTPEERGRCDLKGMVKPTGIVREDEYTIPQPVGTVLWNAVGTPHWVETFDGCAVTLTLVHEALRMDGKLCPLAEERVQWLEENKVKAAAEKSY